ncbi:tetratricopeptide repeat protein [Actinophytocola sediminis]
MTGSLESVLVRADQLAAQGRPHSAIAMLVPAIAEFPEHPGSWCRLAAAHLDAGQPGESLDAAKQAIVLGERSWAHRVASLALVELGRHDEAVVSAREAVRREPEDWRCHVALAEALANDTPADAMRSAGAAVALAPEQARTHEILGDAATRAHDWLAAERAYQQARRLDPDNEDVVAKLARLAARPPADPRRPARPAIRAPARRATGRLGRAERIGLLLLVRRSAAWLVVGSLALLVAGQPAPSRMLAWFGLGTVVFVAALAGHGWRGLPAPVRVSPRELSTREPAIAVSVGLAMLSVLAILSWIVLLVLGSGSLTALLLALGGCSVAAANSWFGLWRIWAGRG